ncbi:MAG TPA: hypothetical protein VI756_05715 [Blastocatellia bacterium]
MKKRTLESIKAYAKQLTIEEQGRVVGGASTQTVTEKRTASGELFDIIIDIIPE